MTPIAAPGATRLATVDDALAAAAVLRELDAGHGDAAEALADVAGLGGLDAAALGTLAAAFGVLTALLASGACGDDSRRAPFRRPGPGVHHGP